MSFYDRMRFADTEKGVETVYKEELKKCYPDTEITYPYKCDGYLVNEVKYCDEVKAIRLIMEFKDDKDFSCKKVRNTVIVQVLYYIKMFQSKGKDIPNVILIGDRNRVFVMHVNSIIKYLDEELQWDVAPSEAYKVNEKLLAEMEEDEKLDILVRNIDKKFSFYALKNDIDNLALNREIIQKITESNIAEVYEYFQGIVLDADKIGAVKLVHAFMDLMLNPDDCFLHPKKKNILQLSNKEKIKVETSAFKAFMKYFDNNYRISEIDKFASIADRLIEDTKRRFEGAFFTPTIWVNEAHKMLDEQLGANWRDEYVVWDCCWGTGNLTRDYEFKELYCSTLEETELLIGKRYNPEATKFQYDFLNDDVNEFEEIAAAINLGVTLSEELFENTKIYKAAPGLVKAIIEGKKILFLINPPYATAKNGSKKVADSKIGMQQSKVKKIMIKNKVNGQTTNLYAEFLYRIKMISDKLSSCKICLYAPPLYMSGESYKNFRKDFLTKFVFKGGFIFNAGHFSGTASSWGITCSLWDNEVTDTSASNDEFKCTIEDVESNSIKQYGVKTIYNMDNKKKATEWVREEVKDRTDYIDYPYTSSALKVKEVGYCKMLDNGMGNFYCNSNNVDQNAQGVTLLTGRFTGWSSIPIIKENIEKCCSLFSARKLVCGKHATWINSKDEYMIPNVGDARYEEWQNNSIVYSLFNTASNQSSLRDIDYNGKTWDIQNEFFFMSKEDMRELADIQGNQEVYNDVRKFNKERYVYEVLQEIELSKEAQDVLDKARELVRESFKYRKEFAQSHPEYHINTWDAGWYQIKGMLKEYMPEQLKEFNELYKVLEDKMRPMVYELGFLRK